MLGIIFVFLLLTLLVIVTVFFYKIAYTHKINQRIRAGEITGRSLVDISKIMMIAVITGLVFFVGVLMFVINDYAHQNQTVSRNNFAVIDVSDPDNYQYASYFGTTGLRDASFAKVYKKDANEGYEKEVITSGPYEFTVFKRTSPPDSFHPDFLCFVEYVGEDKEQYMCYEKAGFQAIVDEKDQFYAGSGGGEITEHLLYLGYLDPGDQFDITMSLLDQDAERKYEEAYQRAFEDDEEEIPQVEDFANETGSVCIMFE